MLRSMLWKGTNYRLSRASILFKILRVLLSAQYSVDGPFSMLKVCSCLWGCLGTSNKLMTIGYGMRGFHIRAQVLLVNFAICNRFKLFYQ